LTVTEEGDTVTKIEAGGKEYIIIGTAHVSAESVDEVANTIIKEKPDNVCAEIDEGRYNSIKSADSWKKVDIFKVIKNKQVFLLLANLALSGFQRRIGVSLDIKPGEEMKKAIETAEKENIPYTFADREIAVTLKRAWKKSSWWGKNKLFAALATSVIGGEKISKEDVEKMKKRSELDSMMGELSEYLPSVKEVLIDERDKFLASKIYNAPGKKILAVVGAGHAPGIINHLKEFDSGKDTDITNINSVPAPSKFSKIIPWVIPVIVVAIICAGFFRSGVDKSLSMICWWILINGTLSAAGALISFAHPLTIILAFISAPITSLNPTVGVGMFTGLLEALLKKPRVEDFETLYDDITTSRGFFKNRITHILIVFFFSSAGSVVGTFIALPFLTSLLT
jgi:pheromone shutdown-related protein TraB